MSDNQIHGDGSRSLPDDIAAKAGLPRQEDVAHSLHDFGDRAEREAKEALSAARDVREDAKGTAETAARDAANAASDVRDRVSDAAQTARGRVEDTVDRVREQAADAYDDVRSWAADRVDVHGRRAADLADRGYIRLRESRSATEAFVSDNPLLVGVVGLAAGLLLGALLPRTRREDEALGPWADEVRDQGLRYAREMTHRGREYVEAALDPDNLDAAVRRADAPDDEGYEGPERTSHRL
ncbi:hypothetical protein [Methylobacterium haplocladii]|uniref:DUF883 domain-containing protein n=1 Tax=Methylobacterium haplocladii TaxID=1176176 RepID=A0A512IRG4_9HYPH|nr:hypothetical protein [Methylobacterium haplocladii]GEP00298.1 hypothetical protein MHA02_26850 [Methylobacterium haplocladii]GJD86069.1 hypothetical protein HPGCJGGD_3966 [Methylobacterium haplocladii]GLS59788.1 hypothetical protein GCM10007887_24610 [Methylobacterium haplocladii]